MAWSALITLACLVAYAHGHGRLVDPPNRASLWRFGYNSPANYDDDGVNCGGFSTQWSANRGQCGICGDAFNLATPRPHELGGRYGLGYIVAKYSPGAVITATVYISAYHRGFWELKLCNNPSDNTQACFDRNVLELETGGTKFYPSGSGTYTARYRLPAGLTCSHCVIQWRYTAGNNWGVCADGTGAVGCGNQENFVSCSDVSILADGSRNGVAIEVPVENLSGDLLKLLILTNEIHDILPPDDPSRKKYKNRHKRKKTSQKAKRRGYKKFINQRLSSMNNI